MELRAEVSFGRWHMRLADDEQRRRQDLRRKGYDDGYAQKPAILTDAVYQAAWRRGREARWSEKNT